MPAFVWPTCTVCGERTYRCRCSEAPWVIPAIHAVKAEQIPDEPAWRKARPLASGVLDYFPDALLGVAHCSKVGNDQHNPGQPLHWAKEKSSDEADALLRHLMARGTTDSDGVDHSAKVAWRALALYQRELDARKPQPG